MESLLRKLSRGLGLGNAARPAASRLPPLLGRLAGLPPADVVRAMTPEVHRCVTAETDFARRIGLIDALREAAETALPALEDEIAAVRLPLAVPQMAIAVTIDNLLKALAGEYQSVVVALAASSGRNSSVPLARAALHATRLLARRQWLATLAGKASSRTAWRQFHRLHRLSREAGFSDFSEGDGSIDHIYRRAILLTLAEADRLPRADLASLRAALDVLTPLVRLTDARATPASATEAVFISGRDPLPMSGDPRDVSLHPAWELHLDAVVEQLQNEIRDAERAREAGVATLQAMQLRLLGRLLERFRGKPIRRFSRQGMRPRVDVVTGIDRLWWALSGPGLSRRRPGELSLAPQDGREWMIVDESPDGFGLKLVRGNCPEIEVGDIVGIGLRDVGRMHVCIVRRVDEDPIQRRRIGVQTLAPDAAAIVVLATEPSRQEAVVHLARLPAHGGRAGLACASGRLTPGTMVRIVDSEEGGALKIGAPIESNGRFQLLLLDPQPGT
ncbi:MAG TPA: hypothetical protein VIS73_06205 [Rhodocyclaceae bacterium]